MTSQKRHVSGWGNPDNHPGIEERARPMFDAEGNPVTEAPPPEPAPELDAFLKPGDAPAILDETHRLTEAQLRQGLAEQGPTVDESGMPRSRYRSGIVRALELTPLPPAMGELVNAKGKLARIRSLAADAMDKSHPAAWAVTLAEILREVDRP